MATTDAYPRDMIGYAGTPPHPRWPGTARGSVNFVLNVEEGSETSVLHCAGRSECGLHTLQQHAAIRKKRCHGGH